jgi:hypothetical protein
MLCMVVIAHQRRGEHDIRSLRHGRPIAHHIAACRLCCRLCCHMFPHLHCRCTHVSKTSSRLFAWFDSMYQRIDPGDAEKCWSCSGIRCHTFCDTLSSSSLERTVSSRLVAYMGSQSGVLKPDISSSSRSAGPATSATASVKLSAHQRCSSSSQRLYGLHRHAHEADLLATVDLLQQYAPAAACCLGCCPACYCVPQPLLDGLLLCPPQLLHVVWLPPAALGLAMQAL